MPNLDEPSVVMDNSSYHSIIINKPPTSESRKSNIKEWLTLNEILFEECHTKAELLCFVNKNTPEPIYEADELLTLNGHEVSRLPPPPLSL